MYWQDFLAIRSGNDATLCLWQRLTVSDFQVFLYYNYFISCSCFQSMQRYFKSGTKEEFSALFISFKAPLALYQGYYTRQAILCCQGINACVDSLRIFSPLSLVMLAHSQIIFIQTPVTYLVFSRCHLQLTVLHVAPEVIVTH